MGSTNTPLAATPSTLGQYCMQLPVKLLGKQLDLSAFLASKKIIGCTNREGTLAAYHVMEAAGLQKVIIHGTAGASFMRAIILLTYITLC